MPQSTTTIRGLFSDAPSRAYATRICTALGVALQAPALHQLPETQPGTTPLPSLITTSTPIEKAHVEMARAAIQNDGLVLVWQDTPSAASAFHAALFSAMGALASPCLESLIAAARIFAFCNALPIAQVQIAASAPPMLQHRAPQLAHLFGASLSHASDKHWVTATLSLNRRGELVLTRSRRSLALPVSPDVLTRALRLLTSLHPAPRQRFAEPPLPDDETVQLIAQPPARLLSEVAAKNLLSALGLPLGHEALCQSASAAERFAQQFPGEVALKLVKPQLRDRRQQDAVRLHVFGNAAIRREYASLIALGRAMGPPESLGVLIAPMYSDAQAFIWLATLRHPQLGSLVALGNGDRIAGPPVAVFHPHADIHEVFRAFHRHWPALPLTATTHLAEVTARFAHAVHTLGNRIDFAQIHPLVVRRDHTVVVLDALVQIADPDNPTPLDTSEERLLSVIDKSDASRDNTFS
ncbi:MAG: hypothetical protein GX146_06105 [Myxococcales bacterium]|nr:hypothetical protein [Myxococcales bacterium]